MKKNELKPDFLPEIRYGKIGVLKVHQITDDELTRLQQGAGQTIFLNLGVAFISISLSFFISLCTTKKESIKFYNEFFMIMIVSLFAGIITMILWWYTRKSIKKLVAKIRNRMPPKGKRINLKKNEGINILE
jgi:Na+/melibiose symporter-like transporter